MIINGDCLEEMKKMEDNSISCIVTDPPYGLSFMGKGWDHAIPGKEYWEECLRVTKPGGHLLAFGGTRTFHRQTCAIEDAGFEIRDCLMWIYGSGFPKSHNKFGCEGYGTALKPAYEPIIMAMKPCDGTFKQNAEKWGQAGINIDGCRIEAEDHDRIRHNKIPYGFDGGWNPNFDVVPNSKGRWPANVLFDEEAAKMLDEQSGTLKSGEHKGLLEGESKNEIYGKKAKRNINPFQANSGGVSRFFYCAKASSRERNEGLEGLERLGAGVGALRDGGRGKVSQNHHPTVKPLKLMEYLITLVMPPKEGVLLDPFAGSGSTILAAHRLGLKAIGIEKSAEYCEIARARLAAKVVEIKEPDLFDELIAVNMVNQ